MYFDIDFKIACDDVMAEIEIEKILAVNDSYKVELAKINMKEGIAVGDDGLYLFPKVPTSSKRPEIAGTYRWNLFDHKIKLSKIHF
jgi:hypothetical protein